MNFVISEDGIRIKVEKSESGNICVSYQDGEGKIQFAERIHFFRALGLFLEAYQENREFEKEETPQFKTNGPMFDCSRNAVMTVGTVKHMLRMMALMGLNMAMLYTEDTYEVESEPYFGYLRGRYTKKELKEIDDYAHMFGIEMIPCIQTLAHLATFLRWDVKNEIKDTKDNFLVNDERTYDFIEELIQAATSPFRTSRIHIGMDEAFMLGRGKYLDQYGYHSKFDIMNTHLKKVLQITEKYQLKPMIWSDMYFRLASGSGDYYDDQATIPQEVIDDMPSNVEYVYWDYYHEKEESYQSYIEKHSQFTSNLIFAGGLWTWGGVCTHYQKAFKTTNAALVVCKQEGIQEVITTLWGDNGSESNVYSALLGLQLYAEHGYARELDETKLRKRFRFCIGGDVDGFVSLGMPDLLPGVKVDDEDGQPPDNPAKYLLWQDPLLGIFDQHIERLKGVDSFYKSVYEVIKNNIPSNPQWDFIFEVPMRLSDVLSIKATIGLKLRQAYEVDNQEELQSIIETLLPDLKVKIGLLRVAHRKQWYRTYKSFGWEVLDIRYGGLLARIDSTTDRVKDYLDGHIDRIEELEHERLPFSQQFVKEGRLGRVNLYQLIATANPL